MNKIFPPSIQTNEFFPNYIQVVQLTSNARVISPNATTDGADVQNSRKKRQAPPLSPDTQFCRHLILPQSTLQPSAMSKQDIFIKNQFTLEETEVVGKVIARIPQNNFWIQISTESGVLQRVGWNEADYSHRINLIDFMIRYEGSPLKADVAEGMEYLTELWEAIQFNDGGRRIRIIQIWTLGIT